MALLDNNISAILHTLAEENEIRNCLGCVKWADEIIVIDMHSDDKTLEIARVYEANSTITMKTFPPTVDLALHPKLRRWDQSGIIADASRISEKVLAAFIALIISLIICLKNMMILF